MPRQPRTHGTAAMYGRGPTSLPDPGYVPYPNGPGCRCQLCKTATTRQSRLDTYLRETGRGKYVDAAPARAHVQLLLDAGMTRYQVAGLTGGAVDRTQIRALMVGQGDKGPSRRIRRITEAALLAVPVQPAGAALQVEKGTVPGVGTGRRLQALLAAGYRPTDLADRLGITRSNICQLLQRERVLAATARKVAALYDLLEQHQADPKVAAYYQARGYLHPGWWDPSTIDDPAHTPAVDVPGGALDRADRRRERRDAVAELVERGLSASDIVAELQACDLLPRDLELRAGMRAVERDKAWWRSQGRRLPVAA